MTKSFLFAVVVATVVATPAFGGQSRGGGGGGVGGESGLPAGIDGPRTIPQQFASKLKLDKSQSPAVDQILTAAATEGAPHAQQMLQARQRMLNAVRAGRADEAKAAQDAYATAAAKIADIEATVLTKVFALLNPNQQKDTAEAFALIAGLFSSPPAGGGARGPGGAR